MAIQYHHTQLGTVILATCAVIAVFGGAIAWRAQPAAAIPMLVILAAVAIIFNSLTVEIEDRELRWYFGLGLWTYRLALERHSMGGHRAKPLVERIWHQVSPRLHALQRLRDSTPLNSN